MTGVLFVGFFLGMTHATEADHIAAVATLAARSSDLRTTFRTGVLWGLGHMTMLVLVGGVVLLVGSAIPEHIAATLESLVGFMLIALGIDVLWRARNQRAPALVHGHAHPHAGEGSRRWRPFVVGLVHGMAGSAALVVLAAGAAHEPAAGLAYVLLFGFGSVFGMAFVSLAMALPLHYAARRLPRIAAWIGVATGILSCVIGALVLAGALPTAMG